MTIEECYGSAFPAMKLAEQALLELIDQYPQSESNDLKAIVYCCSRIKNPDSLNRKLASL